MAKRGPKPKKRLAVDREPIHEPIHTPIHGDEDEGLQSFQYKPFEHSNPLNIDRDIIKSIERDFGFSLTWIAESVLGAEQNESVSARRKNGFAEVVRGNFGGSLDFLCDASGRITKGGLVLMGRPIEIQQIANSYEKRLAKKAITDMRKKHAEEGVDVSMPGGGKHQSALSQNRHRTEMERINVPED